MESCFPPLAALSLRGSLGSRKQKNRHSLGSTAYALAGGDTLAAAEETIGEHYRLTKPPQLPATTQTHAAMSHSQSAYGLRTTTHHDQLTRLEVLQDLDLYYIRQMASSLKELDLEQKIDLEIKMREGSAKLLAACNQAKNHPSARSSTLIGSFGGGSLGGGGGSGGSSNATSPYNTQMLEAAKNLLTSNERMTGYMAELQRRKKDRDAGGVATGSPAKSVPSPAPTTAGKVSLSEIRMPLMWRDSDHFKNKGDHRRFAVFCLVRIDTEIFDTQLLCPVDRNATDISFNDAILFTKVAPDFELKLEVYSVVMESDMSMASTPRKIKNTIHSSISRTVGKRLAANLKDELNNTKIGPKFELIASATLTIDEASDLPHTHDLTITSRSSSHSQHATSPNTATTNLLPLFGHFCCRLAVQPDAIEAPAAVGPLTLHARGPTRPVEGYARLQAFRLELWDSEADAVEQLMPPRRSVEVTRDTKVRLRQAPAGSQIADAVQLYVMEEGTVQEYTLHAAGAGAASEAARSIADESAALVAQRWYAALRRTVREHAQWGHVTAAGGAGAMQLAVPVAAAKGAFLRPAPRQRSLYDQVPIMEHRQSSCSSLASSSSSAASRPHSQQEPTLTAQAAALFAVPNAVTAAAAADTSPTLNDFRLRAGSSSGRSSSGHSSSSVSIGSAGSRKSHWPFGGGK